MLCFDYLQPSLDGHPLAIVRYRLPAGERVAAVGLVRCPPELAAQFPNWSPRVKACLRDSYSRLERPRVKFFVTKANHHPSTWDKHGLQVLEHRTFYPQLGQREYDHRSFASHMTELLQHPLWVATGMAWALRKSTQTSALGPARQRL